MFCATFANLTVGKINHNECSIIEPFASLSDLGGYNSSLYSKTGISMKIETDGADLHYAAQFLLGQPGSDCFESGLN